MTTHTKTPMTVTAHPEGRAILDADGNYVTIIRGHECQANASMIVRAVNAHELLVEALEAYHGVLFRVVTAVSAKGTFSQAHMGNMFVKLLEDLGESKAVAKARAALRAAKEEA